jgi:hypothetical protein
VAADGSKYIYTCHNRSKEVESNQQSAVEHYMKRSLYGISRKYKRGHLFNNSEPFDEYILAQILEITGFQSIEDFNKETSDFDDNGCIPEATHKKLQKLFDLNSPNSWDDFSDPKYVTVYPGCGAINAGKVTIPNPFLVNQKSAAPIARIHSISIKEGTIHSF